MNTLIDSAVPNVVVVDPRFEGYQELADSARLGRIHLHIRSSAAEAHKLARRRRVDAWLVAPDLDDMSEHDLVELLRGRPADAKVAMVEAEGGGSRHHAIAEREAAAVSVALLLFR